MTTTPYAEPKTPLAPPAGFSVWPACLATHLPRTPSRTPISAHYSNAQPHCWQPPDSRISARHIASDRPDAISERTGRSTLTKAFIAIIAPNPVPLPASQLVSGFLNFLSQLVDVSAAQFTPALVLSLLGG
jgi:hypothetical protein